MLAQKDLQDRFLLWQKYCSRFVCSQRVYLEGDGGDRALSVSSLFSDVLRTSIAPCRYLYKVVMNNYCQ